MSMTILDGIIGITVRFGLESVSGINWNACPTSSESAVDELLAESAPKGVTRFISTHPDEDHIQGIEYLDDRMPISNFYCVRNSATKDDETASFKHYCSLRDGTKAYYVSKGRTRRWMNQKNEERGSAGINILWPDRGHATERAG